jgi:hypothetical protein
MDMYLHVPVLFFMILGLGVSGLLAGVAKIVQHPVEYKVYWVHLLWALFLFLYLIHFWWWEYRLQGVQQWTFPLYFFIAIHAVLLFLLCVLFFPEEMADYDSFKAYFYSRRRWIFSLMTVLFIADFAIRSSRAAPTCTPSARFIMCEPCCVSCSARPPLKSPMNAFTPPSPSSPQATKSC